MIMKETVNCKSKITLIEYPCDQRPTENSRATNLPFIQAMFMCWLFYWVDTDRRSNVPIGEGLNPFCFMKNAISVNFSFHPTPWCATPWEQLFRINFGSLSPYCRTYGRILTLWYFMSRSQLQFPTSKEVIVWLVQLQLCLTSFTIAWHREDSHPNFNRNDSLSPSQMRRVSRRKESRKVAAVQQNGLKNFSKAPHKKLRRHISLQSHSESLKWYI